MPKRSSNFTAIKSCPRRRGFTLIEASLTTVIVGVGFLAMLQLLAAGTMSNLRAVETTTAINLAKNIREWTLKSNYASIKALNGTTHQPPFDSQGKTLADFDSWKQTITVQPVDPDRLTLDINDSTPSAQKVTVAIDHHGERVTSVTWYTFDPTP